MTNTQQIQTLIERVQHNEIVRVWQAIESHLLNKIPSKLILGKEGIYQEIKHLDDLLNPEKHPVNETRKAA